jgi:hypothetical protein
MTVTEVKATRREDRGLVFFRNDLSNQRGEPVCESTYTMMIRRRAA